MRYQAVTGLVLRKQNRGESDNYLTIFSPEIGKFNAISKSTRKISSTKGNHLETLNICQIQIYQIGNTNIVTECKNICSFSNIKANLKKSLTAQTILEIANKGIDGTEPNNQVWEILESSLNQLNCAENNPHFEEIVLEKFKIQFLALQGSLPEIAFCFYCAKKWDQQDQIHLDSLGHLNCQNCTHLSQGVLNNIPFNIIKLINFISKFTFTPSKLKISSEELYKLKQISNLYLYNYLQQELKTEKLLINQN